MPLPAALTALAPPLIGASGTVLGGVLGAGSGGQPDQLAAQQYLYNRDFAKFNVQWRTEDARQAGIHPLAALGINPVSYSSAFAGSDRQPGKDFSGLGQDLSEVAKGGLGIKNKIEQRQQEIHDAQVASNASIAALNSSRADLVRSQKELLDYDIMQKKFGLSVPEISQIWPPSTPKQPPLSELMRREAQNKSLIEWRTTNLGGEFYIFPALKSEDADTEVTLDRIKKMAADASGHMGGQIRPPGYLHKGKFAVYQGNNIYKTRSKRLRSRFEMKHGAQYKVPITNKAARQIRGLKGKYRHIRKRGRR